jgi:hypothetical protein
MYVARFAERYDELSEIKIVRVDLAVSEGKRFEHVGPLANRFRRSPGSRGSCSSKIGRDESAQRALHPCSGPENSTRAPPLLGRSKHRFELGMHISRGVVFAVATGLIAGSKPSGNKSRCN